MKINITSSIFFFLLVMVIPGQSYSQKDLRFYSEKSGIIKYNLSGKTSGTETLYFDDHGRMEARYTEATTRMLGMTSEQKSLSLRLDTVMYSIDLNEMTGTKMVISFDPSKMSKAEQEEWEDWGKDMMDDLGFEKVGKGEVLGRNCEIWEGMGTKVWIWESLTLKSEVNLMGEWISEATDINLGAKIDDDIFRVPEGVKITDTGISYDEEDAKEAREALDTIGTELGKELEKSLNELKGILGGKKKK
jgi:hypothetical protein